MRSSLERSSNKVSVAQIGVGYWGPNLLRNFVSHSGFDVKAVVDISAERRKFVTEHYPQIRVSGDPSFVLDDPGIDAVVIATPVSSHSDLSIAALTNGKHILVEKPMATTLVEIEKIAGLAKMKGLVAMVGHTFVFNEAVRYVKALIDSDDLGDIRYIYSRRLNYGRIRSDVDALWNLAPHDISIIQYWLDNPHPISVSRIGMDYVQNKIDDVVFMNIIYPKRIMANIHVSWLDPEKIRKMTVVGSKKMVVYDDVAENKIAIYNKGSDRTAVLGDEMDYDDPAGFLVNTRAGGVSFPKVIWKEPLKTEIDHFFDCISRGKKCVAGVEHAARVVEILKSV